LIQVEEDWLSSEERSEYVVRFLGVEVDRYMLGDGGWPPEGFSPSELEERAEDMIRALWKSGEKKGA
jgi:hypothetical protein